MTIGIYSNLDMIKRVYFSYYILHDQKYSWGSQISDLNITCIRPTVSGDLGLTLIKTDQIGL